MRFTSSAVGAFCLTVGSVTAFSPSPGGFVSSSVVLARSSPSIVGSSGCPMCASNFGCGHSSRLYMSSEETTTAATTEEVPPEVVALEGIESSEEAHNAARPARESIAKKKTGRKPLSEFTKGETVTARVKTITSYGAFMDIGATTDALLHISNLAADFVTDVSSILKEGDEKQVRIMSIDEKKGQVGLTLLTEEEEAAAKARPSRENRAAGTGGGQQQQQNRAGGGGGRREGGGGGRRDDSAVVTALTQKGYESATFVEGTVVSTVDFGAFVRFDASQLNPEVEGEMDGLVHISALKAGRADTVNSVVNVGDKVKVRCLSIDGQKVSLSMVSVEDAQQAAERRQNSGGGGGGGGESVREGAKDWQESLDRIRQEMPTFSNNPLVVDLRK